MQIIQFRPAVLAVTDALEDEDGEYDLEDDCTASVSVEVKSYIP